jgi:arylsulfatase A-like enzyme
MCGLPKPGHTLEGTSLAGTLKNPAQAEDRDVYLPYTMPGAYAIINKNWRYIRYADNTEELYNVQADPNEWTNQAGRPGFETIKTRLRKSAPQAFAKPGPLLNRRRHLVLEGESFHWDPRRRPPAKRRDR